QFLDDLVLLVHLDRIHAAITAMVAVVTNRRLEAADERAHPAVQHIGEANEERQAEAAALQIENQLVQVDARAVRSERRRLDVTTPFDSEEPGGPTADVVQLRRILERPLTQLFQLRSSRRRTKTTWLRMWRGVPTVPHLSKDRLTARVLASRGPRFFRPRSERLSRPATSRSWRRNC